MPEVGDLLAGVIADAEVKSHVGHPDGGCLRKIAVHCRNRYERKSRKQTHKQVYTRVTLHRMPPGIFSFLHAFFTIMSMILLRGQTDLIKNAVLRRNLKS
jgi:hypothetical protein